MPKKKGKKKVKSKEIKGQLGKKKRNCKRKNDWPNNWLPI